MSRQQEFPLIPDDLLSALEKHYPEKTPDIHDSERDIWRDVGHREVVRFLALKRKQQLEYAQKQKLHVQQQRT